MEPEYRAGLAQSGEEAPGVRRDGHAHADAGSRGLRKAEGNMAASRTDAIAARRQHSAPPIPRKKKSWEAQPAKEMVFCSFKKSQSILGAMEEVYERSMKDKLPRKKYMGEWRCDSMAIRTIRPRFHARVMKKIPRNRMKRIT